MGRLTPEALKVIANLCGYGYLAPESSDFQVRLRRNVHGEGRRSTKTDAWNGLLGAILTTQQSSGPGSKPDNVLQSGTLSWRRVNRRPRLIDREIQGFHFNDTKRRQLRAARLWLESNWPRLRSYQKEMDGFDADDLGRYEVECKAANFLSSNETGIVGVGPKQARNFWQYLGYTVWTIPLDSRVQKVLRAPPFSMDGVERSLAGAAYLKVEQEVVSLCRAVRRPKVYPVLLDSVLFNMEGLMRDLAGFPRADEGVS